MPGQFRSFLSRAKHVHHIDRLTDVDHAAVRGLAQDVDGTGMHRNHPISDRLQERRHGVSRLCLVGAQPHDRDGRGLLQDRSGVISHHPSLRQVWLNGVAYDLGITVRSPRTEPGRNSHASRAGPVGGRTPAADWWSGGKVRVAPTPTLSTASCMTASRAECRTRIGDK